MDLKRRQITQRAKTCYTVRDFPQAVILLLRLSRPSSGTTQGHLTHLRGLVLNAPPSISSIKAEPSQRHNGKGSVLRIDIC